MQQKTENIVRLAAIMNFVYLSYLKKFTKIKCYLGKNFLKMNKEYIKLFKSQDQNKNWGVTSVFNVHNTILIYTSQGSDPCNPCRCLQLKQIHLKCMEVFSIGFGQATY